MSSRFNAPLAIGGVFGLVALAVYVAFIVSALLTFIVSLGSTINIAFYYINGNFFIGHMWFASSYATIAVLFFYLTLVAVNVRSVIHHPLAILISVPFSLFVYAVVTGSVDLLHAHITPETASGVFTQDFLTGVIYSTVGASTLNDLFGDDDDEEEEDG